MIAIFDSKSSKMPGLVLVTEADYFDVLMNMLGQAKTSVDILAFAFVTGRGDGHLNFRSLPFQIMEKLKELHKTRGLKIRVFLEGKRETAARNEVTGSHLLKGGIEVQFGSTHAKGVSVDGRYILMGSTNFTDQSLKQNFETNILIDQKAVAKQFTRYFDHYWNGGDHGEITLKPPLFADGDFKDVLLKTIRKAKKRIDFSIYFFDQRDIEQALIAAHKRGVLVTGLVHQHWSFGLSDVKRTKATVARLRRAGLENLTFASNRKFTHSKYLVVDDKELLLGSGNWLDRDVTTHPQLYIAVKNPKLCKTLARHLKSQIENLYRPNQE